MKLPVKLFLLMTFVVSCTGSNLLKNAGAESKPVTAEWTIAEGRWMQRAKAPLPQEGKAYFFPGVAQHAELYQDADVSSYAVLADAGLLTVNYTAYVRAFPQKPADETYEVIEFRNAGGVVIDSFRSNKCDSTNEWVKIKYSQTLPAGTRTIRVRLLSDRHNGSNNDGYHDNLLLTVSLSVLVYIIFIIMVIVVLLIILFLRKRKQLRKQHG